MKLTLKRILTSVLAGVMLLFSCAFGGCSEKVDDYTVEEHIERISERLENRDTVSLPPYDCTYEDFKVYPLYNENEELVYFLVEFEPYGFAFVYLRDELSIFETIWLSILGKEWSMYQISRLYGSGYTWSPYKIDETRSQPWPNEDIEWILDENGERIYYDKSPYYVMNAITETKYLIAIDSGNYICAVKGETGFINLISGEEFNELNNKSKEMQESLFIDILPLKSYNL